MRIAVIGAGGVGGYFGGRLAATGADVWFVARGAHLDAMRARGLKILSSSGDVNVASVHAAADPSEIGPVDVVFFTVKLYDSESALTLLPPLIGPETIVVPFQNGVDSVDMLTRAVGASHVAGGTAYVAAVITEPGIIRHTAMGRIIFGPVHDHTGEPQLEALRAASSRAGFEATLSDKIQVDIWAKFARLTVFSGMTALARSPIGVIREDPDLFLMLKSALHESIAVARAKQIPLPHNSFDDMVAALTSLPANTKSSMLEDLERGRRLELPWLSGAVVRIGEEVGVQTPTHRLIATVLRPHVHGRVPNV
jgi:2-dehydropantoate 2-reductase